MEQPILRWIPLGGLGEVGRNLMAFEYDQEILIVDTGLMFPENDMLGIDYIIPDLTWLKERRERVVGIVITHGHEDHIGAIHHVLSEVQAPVYATPLTRGLIEVKLGKNGLSNRAVIHTVLAGDAAQIGRNFKVEFFHVCHSIPDSVGLGIETPAGLVVHSGDYKFDHTPVDGRPSDYSKLAEFSRRGVLALMADSTNAERAGWTPSEKLVDDGLEQVFRQATGRIIIASFASLVSRMQQVTNAAQRHNRKLAFVGSSMVEIAKKARNLGYLTAPDALILSIEQALTLDDKDVVIMCTGSQGEPTSILGRLSAGANRLFDIKPGDTVVLSSHPIPGNEENVYRVINRLFQRGANVIYESIAPVHVSGHASQEEMKLLIHLVKPKYFIPIHGELRQLRQHSRIAQQLGIPANNIAVVENGRVIEFVDGVMRFGEQIPAPYVFVDGTSVGELNTSVMQEREALASDGLVVVNLLLKGTTNSLYAAPEIATRGFMLPDESQNLMDQAIKKVTDVTARANGGLEHDVKESLRAFFYNETRRKPYVFVNVNRI